MDMMRSPIAPDPLLLLSDLPPKMADQRAILAIIIIAPAIVAAMEPIRMSLFFTWAISWEMTPVISSVFINLKRPSVTATTACSGFLLWQRHLGILQV